MSTTRWFLAGSMYCLVVVLLTIHSPVCAQVPTRAALEAQLGDFKGTRIERQVKGREAFPSGVSGITAFDAVDQLTWYIDRELAIASNREEMFWVKEGRLSKLSQREERNYRKTLLSRVEYLPTHTEVYGDGASKLLYFTAYDCGPCKVLDRQLSVIAKQLNATIYYFPMSLDSAEEDRETLQNILCHPQPIAAYKITLGNSKLGKLDKQKNCTNNLFRSAYTSRLLGVNSVPSMIVAGTGKFLDTSGSDADLIKELNRAR